MTATSCNDRFPRNGPRLYLPWYKHPPFIHQPQSDDFREPRRVSPFFDKDRLVRSRRCPTLRWTRLRHPVTTDDLGVISGYNKVAYCILSLRRYPFFLPDYRVPDFQKSIPGACDDTPVRGVHDGGDKAFIPQPRSRCSVVRPT